MLVIEPISLPKSPIQLSDHVIEEAAAKATSLLPSIRAQLASLHQHFLPIFSPLTPNGVFSTSIKPSITVS